ncbi:MAG: UDP-N-acetylglucosamine--N-acetylmuramyl-(pentapeptide) pyrophosphoryl-undecaprenol N-acetylglucosamine transferase [Egibacteraceae bacterium]
MRLLVSGGGTAGHVYPALALLDGWSPAPTVCWVGSVGGMEQQIVERQGLAFSAIPAGAVRGQGWRTVAVSAGKLAAGYRHASAVLRAFRPDVVLTTGGYVTVSVAAAARRYRVPLVVFLPDVRPGFAVRAQAPLATRIAAAFDAALPALPAGRTVVTGYPVRPALFTTSAEDARGRLGLDLQLPVVLVYGGSRGARTLNEGLLTGLEALLARSQVLHVSGTLDHEAVRARTAALAGLHAGRYHLHAFLGDALVDALVAADLVITRAGASTLAELPAVGVPAIVVPGPFSDQDANADYLAGTGAALRLGNDGARERLVPLALELLDDAARRERMAAASRALARPDAVGRLAGLLKSVARGS